MTDKWGKRGGKMKILNLYAGLGGNRLLWKDVEVTAIESNPQIAAAYRKTFPGDEVVEADAHSVLPIRYKEFGFIWSSPPCRTHSKIGISGQNKTPRYVDMALYQEIIFLQHHYKGMWVVENVKPYYEPLIKPDWTVGRHCFWSNLPLHTVKDVPSPKDFIKTQDRQALLDWLGMPDPGKIYLDGNHCHLQPLRNCVHPEIGRQIMEVAHGR